MNRSSAGIFKMYLKDARLSVIIFWSILFAIYFLMAAVMTAVDGAEANSAGVSPMYVYMFVSGIVGLRESLPYALGMNVRRKDYFYGVMIAAFSIAAAFGAFATLLAVIEEAVTGAFDVRTISFFRVAWFDRVGFVGEFAAHLVFLCFFFALGFFFSLLQKRYGAISLYVLGALSIVAVYLMHLLGAWPSVFRWLISLDSVVTFALWLIPAVAVLVGGSYLLMRRATP
ncbi:hypothetical protein FE782_26580 [Paenibacillus antri]|uniref:Uncharacterized protein n=1 Tax=Paenibacillus antri TaxID=2582848 RepID=A0A5R9G2E8_9BACL|nr:hypothetical protein [Paenibacillus antri]TLS49199.1 hypothetical protein FE782_26580 [Paenibacillus antri]